MKEFFRNYVIPRGIWEIANRYLQGSRRLLGLDEILVKVIKWLPAPTPPMHRFMDCGERPPQPRTHDEYETRMALRCHSAARMTIGPFEGDMSHLDLGVCPAAPETVVSNLKIFVNGEINAELLGELAGDRWTDIRIPVAKAQSFELRLTFDGEGQVDLSDPRAVAPRRKGRMNVLTLMVDNIHLSELMGWDDKANPPVATPNIDRFFADSYRFTNAFSPSEWTLPSMASFMTGLSPLEHGVYNPLRNGADPASNFARHIPLGVPHLCEVLQAGGYRTMMFSTGHHFSPAYGYHRGCDRFILRMLDNNRSVVSAGIQFMEAHKDEPFYCFLHPLDLHYPFGELDYLANISMPGKRWAQPVAPYMAYLTNDQRQKRLEGLQSFRYAKIRDLDLLLGTVFSYLESSGLIDNTIVILTADHSHGNRRGTPVLMDDVTHVPLMVRLPGGGGGVNSDFIEAGKDYYPIVLGLLGLDVPAHATGKNPFSDNYRPRDICIVESPFRGRFEISLRNNDWTYILRCGMDMKSGEVFPDDVDKEFLYPKGKDGTAGVAENIIADHPEIAGKFRKMAQERIRSMKRFFDSKSLISQDHWRR